ncbi:protein FAR-RED IMPAIRED RESPONSE 1-like [Andrographis paniculata]|uniref:protein FAR-RED IMPAIRED RESPONSE 1-like n=1 Tax=Andrographis paniculata TaxID=175694 RepID=UPI0021E6EF9A|nr:protein FAR-RED IMPAIRED RESPONSE 1-like [Andrographis paniculata]
MEVGDTRGVLEYLQGMQNRDLNSSYSIQVDEDDMITNIFWVDGRMRADYIDFGDVVSFNTTYRKYKENRPLALFVGVNHHRQTIVFGATLLYDETIPSFEWLFDTFVNTMYGRKPTRILTDQDPTMANALASRWPETHHRCVYDFDEEDEFLHEWNEMLVKYNLVDNDWLRRLFNLKEKWALVYGRQFFCADITTTQRSESINSVIKRYSSSKNNLRVFFENFENLVKSRRYEQLQADSKASTSAYVLPLSIQLLKHAASVYTPEVFKIFQKELGKAYDCFGTVTRSHETITEYHVSYLERSRYHIVKYDSSDKTVACSYKKFDFSEILYSHRLKILTKNDVLKILDQYILKRWTKDARLGDLHSRMYVGDHSMDDPKKSRKENYDGISLKGVDNVGMNNKDNIHIKGINNRTKTFTNKAYLASGSIALQSYQIPREQIAIVNQISNIQSHYCNESVYSMKFTELLENVFIGSEAVEQHLIVTTRDLTLILDEPLHCVGPQVQNDLNVEDSDFHQAAELPWSKKI